MSTLLLNEAIYHEFLLNHVYQAKQFIWIVTADIKDIHVNYKNKFVPFLKVLNDLVVSGVSIRLIHAKEPGPIFRADFDLYPELFASENFERILCPRVHTKCIIIDSSIAFVGSANLTGAGLGAKHPDKRNFEAGVLIDDAKQINQLMTWVDGLYLGDYCIACKRRKYCPDPIR